MDQPNTDNLPAVATVAPDPFSTHKRVLVVDEGKTLADIVRGCSISERAAQRTSITIDGFQIHRDYWHVTRPKNGTSVIVRVVPGKDAARSILTFAVFVAAFYVVGPWAVSISGVTGPLAAKAVYLAAAAGTYIAGSLLVNALIPLPKPKFPASGEVSQALSVAAPSNRLEPFAAMPEVLGFMRVYPPYAAYPYTEIIGDAHYLRALFVVGYCDLEITDIKLGETPITEYTDVDVQIRQLSTDPMPFLFTNSVIENSYNIKLTTAYAYSSFVTATDSNEGIIDYAFPNGLGWAGRDGSYGPVTVIVALRYRDADVGGAWTDLPAWTHYANVQSTLRYGRRIQFPYAGRWEVEIARTTDDQPSNYNNLSYWMDDVYVTGFRSVRYRDPVSHPNAALIAIRIKATDQLAGAIQNLNCMARKRARHWNGSSWAVATTNNPSAMFRHVLQGNANAKPLADSRIDLPKLQAWSDYCVANGFTFNMYRDFKSTVWDTLADICAAGRARPAMIDGKWTVVYDEQPALPVQHFTPRNSWGLTATRIYLDMPHAFRVRFVNEMEGYKSDERIVYDNGYDSSNATRFEAIEFPGATNPNSIWKHARYNIAVARLRPEVLTWNADIENIVCTQGDWVKVAHDVILVGLASARIKSLTGDLTNVTHIEVDETLPMETGVSYAVRIRHADGSSSEHALVNPGTGEYTTVEFATPIPNANAPSTGDLVMYGESGLEAIDIIVDSIVPGPDLTAQIQGFPLSPAVYSADTGTIPSHQTFISYSPGSRTPILETQNIRSDETVMIRGSDGTLQIRMLVPLPIVNHDSINGVIVQYRDNTSTDAPWVSLPVLGTDSREVSIYDVIEGVEYQVRARYLLSAGEPGPWSAIVTHTVIGKSTPPPPVTSFSVVRQPDGTREFSWAMLEIPPDLAGFRIRYGLGVADPITPWESLAPLHTGLLVSSPWETNLLAAGTYTVAIKAVDTSGNESADALYITSTLGDPRIKNALMYEDVKGAGWPGVYTDCYVTGKGDLVPASTATWATLGVDWDNWTAWNNSPVAFMSYEQGANYYDLGAVATFQPLISVQTADLTGTVVVYERHKDNLGDAWSAWSVVDANTTLSTRYVQFKVDVTNPPIGGLTRMFVILSADTIEEYINDINTAGLGSVGDFRLPLTKQYSLITSVQVALQTVGSGYTWELMDRNASLGPRIRIWNGANPADCVIDAVVIGIAQE